MQEHQIIGSIIRAKRKENGISQLVLSQRLGCAQSYISKIEQGKIHLELVDYLRFCEAIGISREALLTELALALKYQ